MADLDVFQNHITLGVTKGHDGSTLSSDSWSGFACIVNEGGKITYSASLKLPIVGDPAQFKPVYQRQLVTGFYFRSIRSVIAKFNNQEILRTQLEYVTSMDQVKLQMKEVDEVCEKMVSCKLNSLQALNSVLKYNNNHNV